jgi:hypothetical protein
MTTGNIGGGGPKQPLTVQQCVDLNNEIQAHNGAKKAFENLRSAALETKNTTATSDPIGSFISGVVNSNFQAFGDVMGGSLPQINRSLQAKIKLFDDNCKDPPDGASAGDYAQALSGRIYQLDDELQREGYSPSAIINATKEAGSAQSAVQKQALSSLNLPDIGAAAQGAIDYAKDHPGQAIGIGIGIGIGLAGVGALALLAPAGAAGAIASTGAAAVVGAVGLSQAGAGQNPHPARQA